MFSLFFKFQKNKKGFSIVEMIIGVAVFAMIAVSIYTAFSKIVTLVNVTKLKVVAINLINEQFELIRNLSYDDVGLEGGLPSGLIDHEREVIRNQVPFIVTTTVRNIDDPYDGTIGGDPNDTSPADYKMVEVSVDCHVCKNFTPVSVNSIVAPKSLETSSSNGALFVQVFDASGQPISGVDVSVENNNLVPAIIINDTTNQNGLLQIIDTPPAVQSYEVSVSKDGYSSDQTYPPGDVSNPNPIKSHSTVAVGQVTQISFAIDRVGQINFSSLNEVCASVPNVDFTLQGEKLIGTDPDILKYDSDFETDNFGLRTVGSLEWDTYNLNITDSAYDLLGINPEFPTSLLPGEIKDIEMILAPKSPNSLIVNVKDGITGLPLSGVLATLSNNFGFSESNNTGRGFVGQNDWSGGGGQDDFIDIDKFFESNQIDYSAGNLKLAFSGSDYLSTGSLVSSSFDLGSPSNFYELNWTPESQPIDVGDDSVKFQLAVNNDNETWNFTGPDGTDQTFYTLTNRSLSNAYNGNQYFRYKVFLETASTTFTPSVSNIAVTFASDCVSPGQTRFSGLADGSYTILLEKSGYQPVETTLNISDDSVYETFILNES